MLEKCIEGTPFLQQHILSIRCPQKFLILKLSLLFFLLLILKFKCIAFVHVHSHNHDKLNPRAIKCLFLGYTVTKRGYRCFDHVNRKLYIYKDVMFFEQ